jgi:hypothetical protein
MPTRGTASMVGFRIAHAKRNKLNLCFLDRTHLHTPQAKPKFLKELFKFYYHSKPQSKAHINAVIKTGCKLLIVITFKLSQNKSILIRFN